MRHIALSLVSVLALTAPAFASGTPATPPAAPAAAPAAPAPAGTTATANPGISPDIGKLVDVATIPALQNIVVAGTQLRYIGDEHGLKAYFVSNAGQAQILYITPDGQASLVGAMFSGDGTPVSVMQLARLRQTGFDPVPYLNNNVNPSPVAAATGATAGTTPPVTAGATAAPAVAAPTMSAGEQLLAETKTASWIAFGESAGREVTVFMDPNCDHCHNLFKALQPYVAANKIYLRVIPVVVIGENSRTDNINILSAADPQAVWTAKINGQPVPVPNPVNPQAEVSVARNTTLFTRWQLPVAPYTVYRTNAGEVKVVSGTPTDFNAFLTDLGITP